MNMSEVITTIKLKLGLMTMKTPFENLDEMMTETINALTLPSFNAVQPQYIERVYDLRNLQLLNKSSNAYTYLLPDEFINTKILFIRDVRYDEQNLWGIPYYPNGRLTGNIARGIMLGQAGINLAAEAIPKMTHEFIPPRTVKLYNVINSCRVVFDMAIGHYSNIASIPETCREAFIRLATLDIKTVLYNAFKPYDGINSAYGSIALKIEDWADAEQKRDDLIDEWGDNAHLDSYEPEWG